MKPFFLDANVILRYLLGDDPAKPMRSRQLMRRLERAEEIVETSDLVIAEVVWIATSKAYQLTRTQVRDRLRDIVGISGLRLPDEAMVLESLDLFATTRIDYIDAYNAAVMRRRGVERIYSYDRDFDGLPGISRVEP